jgi:uncharacterized protein (TIGR00255 family)
MVLSMTGFGKSTGTFNNKKLSIEIRTLNSKSLDLNFRLPNIYRELEATFRNIIASQLERGKIDFILTLEGTGDAQNYVINKDLATTYYQDLKALNTIINGKTEDYLSLILRMPDIFINDRQEISAEEKEWIFSLTADACAKVNDFRKQEGGGLYDEFTNRINDIQHLLDQVPQYEQQRVDNIRERLKRGLEEFAGTKYDENRLEQELIFYIEKLDISEEKMRLGNHLNYFLDTLKVEASGKKLGFISQEIGREINTLGSKCNHVAMQKLVVEMKDNLEKIKEQILNTL